MGVRLGTVEVTSILCATDFSQHSIKAVEFAKKICDASGAGIDVVQVINPLPSGLRVNAICRAHRHNRPQKMQVQ